MIKRHKLISVLTVDAERLKSMASAEKRSLSQQFSILMDQVENIENGGNANVKNKN